MKKIIIYLKLIRVKHYIKNMLLFIPIVFSHAITRSNVKAACFGFLAFSFMASTIYIINDIKDVKNDRNHPTKKNRPIASGEVSMVKAGVIAVLMFTLSLVMNYFVKEKVLSYTILFSYFSFNLFYSFGLKNKPIVDIMILVSLYILRIYYGGAIVGVDISDWLFLTVTFGAAFLTFGKRRNEYMRSIDTRHVLKYYNKEFLDKLMYLSLALTLVFYSLWTIEQEVKHLSISILLLFIIFLKYSLIVEGDSDGDPTEVIFRDKSLLFMGLLYLLVMFGLMR